MVVARPRLGLVYGERRTAAAAAGFDPDEPVEGYYATRLVMGGVRVGVHIFYGPPRDPDTGEEMDRGWRWQALMNEQPVDLERVWPKCAGEPVDEAEYRHLTELQRWGQRNGVSAAANPRAAADPLRTPVLF